MHLEDREPSSELPKILVVDDRPKNLLAMETLLGELAVEVIRAMSGDETLRLVLRHRFVVVLLDVKMPGMSGIETATLMQGHEKAAQTPVIFVTGHGTDELDELKGYAAGAADYIIKPINPEILLSKVRMFLKLYLQAEEIEDKYRETALLQHELKERNLELETNYSALANANAQLNQSNAELERSNHELEHFAHAVSHDLQEPLRMVNSYMQLLEKRYQAILDERANEYIFYAKDGAVRMERMIKGLLKYSRVGLDSHGLEVLKMTQMVELACFNLKLVIEDAGAEIEVAELPTVSGDRDLLIRLFQNLINNSLKYNEQPTPSIHISAERGNGEWVFSVRDNGIGIAESDRERIFEIFQRLHTVDQYSGCGLGLSTCKKIVEHLSGKIWLESSLGEGSTFYFSLPDAAEKVISNVA